MSAFRGGGTARLHDPTFFRVTMPGQPPSWNSMYGWKSEKFYDPIQQRERYRMRNFKQPEVETYQAQLTMLTRAAKPSDFSPSDKVIVAYVLFVKNDVDTDNVMKACNDAIARGVGVDDRRFLSLALEKFTGQKEPRLEIAVYDAEHWQAQITRR